MPHWQQILVLLKLGTLSQTLSVSSSRVQYLNQKEKQTRKRREEEEHKWSRSEAKITQHNIVFWLSFSLFLYPLLLLLLPCTPPTATEKPQLASSRKKRGAGKEKVQEMGILYDDVVIIRHSEKEGDPAVITVNCPDKTGLGCDLCRIILFFGLSIVRGGKDPKERKVSIFRACLRVFSAQYFVFHTFSLWKTKVCVCAFLILFLVVLWKKMGIFVLILGVFGLVFDVVKMFLRMGNGAT